MLNSNYRSEHMAAITNLQDLIKNLQLHRFDDRSIIEEIISVVELDIQKTIDRCNWDEKKYTRNLVHRGEIFEVLLLCWLPGQSSPIHDHSDSSCWMKVITGEGEEEIYSYNKEDNSLKDLKLKKSRRVKAGEFVYIDDKEGVHRVINTGSQKLITLHIYAKPIGECLRYLAKEDKTEIATFQNDIQLDIAGL
jgi:cysteine dioxygenase